MLPRILVVDDDPDQLTVRSMLLGQYGFHTQTACTPQEALQIAKAHTCACAVLDLALPLVQDGLELIQSLRDIQPGMRLLVLTGRNVKHVAAIKGVDTVLQKGSATQELIAALRRICGGVDSMLGG